MQTRRTDLYGAAFALAIRYLTTEVEARDREIAAAEAKMQDCSARVQRAVRQRQRAQDELGIAMKRRDDTMDQILLFKEARGGAKG